jgi:putative transposase
MPENGRFSGSISRFDLDFVKHKETPRQLIKLSIQLYLDKVSFSNTVPIFEIFGVELARCTVHNWVHKADLQLEGGRRPNLVSVDETVIQLDDQRYWLYAAVDLDTNESLHRKVEPTQTDVIDHTFFRELRDKHDVDDAVFLIDGAAPLKDVCQ